MLGDPTRIIGRDNASLWAGRKGGAGWVEYRPPGVGDASYLGTYGFSVVTGVINGSGTIFSAFWSHATKIAAVTRLRWRWLPLTGPTAPGVLSHYTSYRAFFARPFNTDFTNGTVLDLTGNSMKRRASMASSAFGSIRVWATAGLTGGAGTFDPHPFAHSLRTGVRVNPAAGTEEVIQPYVDHENIEFLANQGDHPLILTQNEGFLIQQAVANPIGNTGLMVIEMNWSEYETAADY
jgi:hypothetical protein